MYMINTRISRARGPGESDEAFYRRITVVIEAVGSIDDILEDRERLVGARFEDVSKEDGTRRLTLVLDVEPIGTTASERNQYHDYD